MRKGYFPHKFNTPQNQNYVDKFPPKESYSPELMSISDKEKFESWYACQTNVFNLQEELRAYCESDVEILKKGALNY
jgi:hypothetical protein